MVTGMHPKCKYLGVDGRPFHAVHSTPLSTSTRGKNYAGTQTLAHLLGGSRGMHAPPPPRKILDRFWCNLGVKLQNLDNLKAIELKDVVSKVKRQGVK